jgi:hypothetical protein
VASTIATALTQFLNIALQQEGRIPQLARKMDATALNQQLSVAQVQLAAVEVQLVAVESGLLEPDADKVYLRKKEDLEYHQNVPYESTFFDYGGQSRLE